jgi:hypothetical protein
LRDARVEVALELRLWWFSQLVDFVKNSRQPVNFDRTDV